MYSDENFSIIFNEVADADGIQFNDGRDSDEDDALRDTENQSITTKDVRKDILSQTAEIKSSSTEKRFRW